MAQKSLFVLVKRLGGTATDCFHCLVYFCDNRKLFRNRKNKPNAEGIFGWWEKKDDFLLLNWNETRSLSRSWMKQRAFDCALGARCMGLGIIISVFFCRNEWHCS